MKKLHFVALGALLVAFVLLASALLVRGQSWGDDFAQYLTQAKSILNGSERQTVEQNVFTIDNSTVIIGPPVYPWGYPLALALYYRIFGLNPLALNSLNILFLCFFIIVLFVLLRNRLSPLAAVLVAAVIVFSPELITFENSITNDFAFMSFSTLAILLIDRYVCENNKPKPPILKNIALGAAIFLAYFMRIPGALLLVTLFGCQIIALLSHSVPPEVRKKMLLVSMVPYLVFAILWGLSGIIFTSDVGYVRENLSIVSQITITWGLLKDHLWYYYHQIDRSFLPSLPGAPTVYRILLVFLLIGIAARVKKDYAFIIYSALMVLLIVVYSVLGGFRMLFPILPFFVYFSLQGMKVIFSRLPKHYRAVGLSITYLFWIGVMLLFLNTSIKLALANLAADRQVGGPFDAVSTQMFNYIKTATPPDSVIVFFKPRAMRLMTDRNAFVTGGCDRLNRGNFVVLLKGETGDQIPVEAIGSCGMDIKQVFENEKFIAYQLVK